MLYRMSSDGVEDDSVLPAVLVPEKGPLPFSGTPLKIHLEFQLPRGKKIITQPLGCACKERSSRRCRLLRPQGVCLPGNATPHHHQIWPVPQQRCKILDKYHVCATIIDTFSPSNLVYRKLCDNYRYIFKHPLPSILALTLHRLQIQESVPETGPSLRG